MTEEETLGDLLEISYDEETGICSYAYHNPNYHVTGLTVRVVSIEKGKPMNYDQEIVEE